MPLRLTLATLPSEVSREPPTFHVAAVRQSDCRLQWSSCDAALFVLPETITLRRRELCTMTERFYKSAVWRKRSCAALRRYRQTCVVPGCCRRARQFLSLGGFRSLVSGRPLLQRQWKQRPVRAGDIIDFVSFPACGRLAKWIFGPVATIAPAAFARVARNDRAPRH
jgi:hypothetical protein